MVFKETKAGRIAASRWMRLARLFASLPLICPNCANMRIIAFITGAAPVEGDKKGRIE